MISQNLGKQFIVKYRKYIFIILSLVFIICVGIDFLIDQPLIVADTINRAFLRINGFQSKKVQLGNYRTHYWVGGKGEPMVLVPGLGGKGIDFTFLMPELAKKYRIYSIDLLGLGESDKPIDVDYSTDFQAHQLFRFFESQKITNVFLMGHSLGGISQVRF